MTDKVLATYQGQQEIAEAIRGINLESLTQKAVWVDSVADMRELDVPQGITVATRGYYEPNDGGNGFYYIRAKEVGAVDDGGSVIFLDNDNEAKLITDGTVNVKQFGVKADGTTDDTTAFEKAVNTGHTVFVPNGNYYLASAINNTNTNGKIVLIGQDKYLTKIKLGNSLLQNDTTNSVIKRCYFSCNQSNSIVVFPSQVIYSYIAENQFHYFYAIFNYMKTLTQFVDNSVLFLQGYFCRAIVDSFITGNYINAPKVSNPQSVCFGNLDRDSSTALAHSRIENNFIDFFYRVFSIQGSNNRITTVVGNTFDVCYSIFYGSTINVTFTGNAISNATYALASALWNFTGNAEMSTATWSVIHRASGSQLINCYFGGNDIQDIDIYVCNNTPGSGNYPTHHLVIDEAISADKFDWKMYKSGYANDTQFIDVRPIKRRTVVSLPSVSGVRTTFIGDEFFYNGDLYTVNADWKFVKISDPNSASAVPTTGTYKVGDIVYNSVPTAGGYVGWVCVTAGTPGTWKGFGAIEA